MDLIKGFSRASPVFRFGSANWVGSGRAWGSLHLEYACVRESVRTQDIGQGELHSHSWHVDI